MKLKANDLLLIINNIRDLCSSRKYGEALTKLDLLIGEIEGLCFSSYFLIERSILIQLQDDEMNNDVCKEKSWTLEDAEKNLRDAILIDPYSLEALIELGYFVFVGNDDKTDSLSYFEKAIDKCNDSLERALLGKIKCILEIEGPQAAKKLLVKAERQFPDSKRFVDVKSDILQQLHFRQKTHQVRKSKQNIDIKE